MGMTGLSVQDGHRVGVSYDLFVRGRKEDSASREEPLEFIYGYGQLLPSFESHLSGLRVGEDFDFTLSAEEGYGRYNEGHCFWLERSLFQVEGRFPDDVVYVGATVPMLLQGGGRMQGVVREMSEDRVLMDFNHPFAGEELHFCGRVERVEAVDAAELEALFSGSCGGGCSCGCGHEHGGDHSGHGHGGGCGCGCC